MLSNYYLSLLLVFFIIAFVFIVDRNVADYFLLSLKIVKINIDRYYWMIRLHPKNPITNFMMRKKYNQIAKDLHKELIQKPID